MKRSWIYGLILVGLVAALLGGYYWYSLQNPTIQSAEEYVDTGFPAFFGRQAAPASPSNSEETSQIDEGAAPNPPLSSDTDIVDIETDLNQTVILDEDFSDL